MQDMRVAAVDLVGFSERAFIFKTNRRFLFFVNGPVDVLEPRDRKKSVSSREFVLEICMERYSNV